jgi:hypothetical protein
MGGKNISGIPQALENASQFCEVESRLNLFS